MGEVSEGEGVGAPGQNLQSETNFFFFFFHIQKHDLKVTRTTDVGDVFKCLNVSYTFVEEIHVHRFDVAMGPDISLPYCWNVAGVKERSSSQSHRHLYSSEGYWTDWHKWRLIFDVVKLDYMC